MMIPDNANQKPYLKHYWEAPLSHPSWLSFKTKLLKENLDVKVISTAWKILLRGFYEQEQIEKRLELKNGLTKKEWYLYRSDNKFFKKFAIILNDALKIKNDSPLALWSGGILLSTYAFKRGFIPMEKTILGKVLMSTKIHAKWSLCAVLWNTLSSQFIKQAKGEVHIFLRTYDIHSVLIRQELEELNTIRASNPKVKLFWHPVYTNNKEELCEIDEKLNLVSNVQYTIRDICVALLLKYLTYIHEPTNTHAICAQKSLKL